MGKLRHRLPVKSLGLLLAFSVTAWGNSPPRVIAMNPPAFQDDAVRLDVTVEDLDGARDVAQVHLSIGHPDQASACYVLYDSLTRSIRLRDTNGQTWLGPLPLQDHSRVLRNLSCSAGAPAIELNGGLFTFTVNLAFSSSFAGARDVYARVIDTRSIASPWLRTGAGDTRPASSAPTISWLGPSGGIGTSETFFFLLKDDDGAARLRRTEIAFTGIDGRNCLVALDIATRNLWLRNDSDTTWLGPSLLRSGSPLSNSRCRVNGSTALISAAGTTAKVGIPVAFTTQFGGGKQITGTVSDSSNLSSGWSRLGSWSVSTSPAAPKVRTGLQMAGSGNTFTATAVFEDPQGSADLATVSLLIANDPNGDPAFSPACEIRVDPATGQLWVRDHFDRRWIGPQPLGAARVVGNSHCEVDLATALAQHAGTHLTLILPLRVDAPFLARSGGAKSLYGFAADRSGLQSEWRFIGGWAPVPAATAPRNGAVAVSGSGSARTISVTFFDPQGDFSAARLVIGDTLRSYRVCALTYSAISRQIMLRDDQGLNFAGGGLPGSATVLRNSSCQVDLASAKAVRSTGQLELSLPVVLSPTFPGPKGVYVTAIDFAGAMAPWSQAATLP